MRRIVGILGPWAVVVVAASQVSAQAPPRENPAARPKPAVAKARAVVNQAALNRLLDEWQEKCAGIKTLDAKFTRIDTSKVWGDKTYFEGRALLKAPNLACLDVQRLDKGGKKSFEERIICTGKEIWQYVGQGAQTFVFPLAANNQEAALQQGPLPFLFDMNAAKLKERYDVLLLKTNPQSYDILITPREAIDKKNFEQALLRLNKGTLLPEILILKANNGDKQEYQFSTVGRNAPVNDDNFKGKPWDGFKVIHNPDRNAQPRQIGRGGVPAPRENPPALGARARRRGE